MSDHKDQKKILAKVLRKTHGCSDPIEVEFTVRPEDHEDGPEWVITRAAGKLPDLAWLDGDVGNAGFKDIMEGAIPGALQPGRYKATIRLSWRLYDSMDGEEYEDEVECLSWHAAPSVPDSTYQGGPT